MRGMALGASQLPGDESLSATTATFCAMIAFIIAAAVTIMWTTDLRTPDQICAIQSKQTPWCKTQTDWLNLQVQEKMQRLEEEKK